MGGTNELYSILPSFMNEETWLFPSLDSPSSPFGIYDLASSGTPLLNLDINFKFGNPLGEEIEDIIINGIITLF